MFSVLGRRDEEQPGDRGARRRVSRRGRTPQGVPPRRFFFVPWTTTAAGAESCCASCRTRQEDVKRIVFRGTRRREAASTACHGGLTHRACHWNRRSEVELIPKPRTTPPEGLHGPRDGTPSDGDDTAKDLKTEVDKSEPERTSAIKPSNSSAAQLVARRPCASERPLTGCCYGIAFDSTRLNEEEATIKTNPSSIQWTSAPDIGPRSWTN
jgi:hypothetical protein